MRLRERDELLLLLPVPPKMCISICSSRFMRKVSNCGSHPSVKSTGKNRMKTREEIDRAQHYYASLLFILHNTTKIRTPT